MIYLEIPGEPVAKQRPRVMRSGITFTPKKTLNYETLVKELFIISKQPMLEGELKATIIANFQIPKSATKAKRVRMEGGLIRPVKRPDLDNIAKAVLDALNGLAYQDDSQIVRLVVEKYYSAIPGAEITIEEV